MDYIGKELNGQEYVEGNLINHMDRTFIYPYKNYEYNTRHNIRALISRRMIEVESKTVKEL